MGFEYGQEDVADVQVVVVEVGRQQFWPFLRARCGDCDESGSVYQRFPVGLLTLIILVYITKIGQHIIGILPTQPGTHHIYLLLILTSTGQYRIQSLYNKIKILSRSDVNMW